MSRPARALWPDEPLRVEQVIDLASLQWRVQAACQGTDPEMWFSAESTTQRAHLERICATCPVFSQCLDHAIAYDEKGFWAGTTRIDRHEIVAEETGQQAKYHRYEPKH